MCIVVPLSDSDVEAAPGDGAEVYRGGSSVGSYTTLEEAFAAAQDGDRIVLEEDFTGVGNIRIDGGKHVTLDLNNHSVHFALNNRFNVFVGGLTVTGTGTLSEQENGFYYAPIMAWGTTDDLPNRCIIEVGPDVTLRGWCGVFINRYTDATPDVYGIVIDIYGTIESARDTSGYVGACIYINGQIQDVSENAPSITVHEGAVLTSEGNGIYAAGYAHWTFLGGDMTAQNALSIKSGTFEISGGTFRSTGPFIDPAVANNNGSEDTGAALSITSNKGYAKEIRVNVTGGTFISEKGYAVYEGIAQKNDGTPADDSSTVVLSISGGSFTGADGLDAVAITTAPVRNVITGGSFSSDISEYLSPGTSASGTVTYSWTGQSTTYYGGVFTISTDVPAKEGSTLKGFRVTGSSTLYQMGDTATASGDVTVTPVWSSDIPPIIFDDDEEEEVVGGITESEGKDDSTTVVACAAAAVVAALMAAFLILDRKP